MKRTTEHTKEILSIISLLKMKYPRMLTGEYQMHFVNERNQYVVLFTNNASITIHRLVAQDMERNNNHIDEETLKKIIDSLKQI